MESINFETYSFNLFANWLIDNYVNFHGISCFDAFDLRTHGIALGTNPTDGLPYLFSKFNTKTRKDVFEKGICHALNHIDPATFPHKALLSIISVIHHIKSKDTLITLNTIAKKKKWKNYCPDVCSAMLYTILNSENILSSEEIYTMQLDWVNKNVVCNVFMLIIDIMPDKWVVALDDLSDIFMGINSTDNAADCSIKIKTELIELIEFLHSKIRIDRKNYNLLISNPSIESLYKYKELKVYESLNKSILNGKTLNNMFIQYASNSYAGSFIG